MLCNMYVLYALRYSYDTALLAVLSSESYSYVVYTSTYCVETEPAKGLLNIPTVNMNTTINTVRIDPTRPCRKVCLLCMVCLGFALPDLLPSPTSETSV